jgi:hypothetical protein
MIVDITLLQSVSYVAAAIGVCIAAFYYALNFRETTKNRREILTNNLLQNLYTEEDQMRFITLFARTRLSA